ncbi:glycosyltransferase [Myroides odoratimimus]|uniref:glycosyltransferase n=1 Tax=Myroides odoratimimus TaxID=76832 RepID=UPI0025770C35|nr:glycosyltransferase [Myroides odoratimimus]MDM1066147.1 glycosyltransferase [Myroides odoratimimus]MEC4076558.1 glycosyltransferase [Myroides odoratimimus]
MRILHLIDSLNIGGAERLLIETIPYLVSHGYTVDVALLNGEKTSFYKKLETLKECKIISLGFRYYDLSYFFKLKKLSKEYDIIHVHLFPAQYYIGILKYLKLIKNKIIFTEHSTSNRRLQSSFFRIIERPICGQYDTIICITNEVKKVLLNYSIVKEDRIVIIENGVNLKKIRSSKGLDRKDFGYSISDVLLIKVAGFRREKDQDTVITSLVKLPINYKLVLVGDGERRSQLEHLVKELKLDDRIVFLGVRDDVYDLMKMCDIVVLSSHWEGFGLVAVEAMASGIPLIASNVEGLAQVVDGGGLLFEKGNVNDLVEKILSLEEVEFNRQIRYNCSEKAKQYDVKMMIDKLIKVYETV